MLLNLSNEEAVVRRLSNFLEQDKEKDRTLPHGTENLRSNLQQCMRDLHGLDDAVQAYSKSEQQRLSLEMQRERDEIDEKVRAHLRRNYQTIV